MLDFLEKDQWPGRKVREGKTPAADAQGSDDSGSREESDESAFEPARLVPEGEAARVRGRLDNTRRNLADLREEARSSLKETLHLPAGSERPQLQNAVNYLSGHHREFGDSRPEIPNDHKIGESGVSAERLQELLEEAQGADGQIDPAEIPEEARRLIEESLEDGQLSRPEETPPTEVNERIYRRALDVLDRGDRIAFGFDSRQVASTDYDGTVETYGSISSPAEAAGEIDPPTRPERRSIDAAIDERMFMTKREIFLMVFYAVMYSVLYWAADTLRSLADSVSIKVGVGLVSVNLTWPITYPLYIAAKVCRRVGQYFEELAMGMHPSVPGQEPRESEREPNPSEDRRDRHSSLFGGGSKDGEFEDGTGLDSQEGRARIAGIIDDIQSNMRPSYFSRETAEGPAAGNYGGRLESILADLQDDGSEEDGSSGTDGSNGNGQDGRDSRGSQGAGWDLDSDRYEGSAGLVFLMSAVQIDQAVRSAAEGRGSEDLQTALRTYLQSRESDRLYNVQKDLADEFGVDTGDLELESASRLEELEPLEVELEGPGQLRDYIINPRTRQRQSSTEEERASSQSAATPRTQSIASDEDNQPFEC